MSFFGFDTTLPRDRKVVPGFSSQHDAFAGLEGGGDDDHAYGIVESIVIDVKSNIYQA